MVVDMSAINVPVAVLARRARPIVERIIWCTVSTVGPDGTPRSRLMHPVWWWDRESPAALVSARPTPLKRAHLAANPFVSCYYWDPDHDTVAIDAVAEWVPESGRAAAWDAVRSVAAPVGFDPVVIWPGGPNSDDCSFLRFTAHRIIVTPAGGDGLRWLASPRRRGRAAKPVDASDREQPTRQRGHRLRRGLAELRRDLADVPAGSAQPRLSGYPLTRLP